jgi:FKBP-type peptidyl-prolyl cis-trans isomerase
MSLNLEAIEKEYAGQIQESKTGLKHVVLKEGEGRRPKRGSTILAHYTGCLTNGVKFDSSVDRGEPFSFDVGVGEVIPAWDEAMLDMTQGEKRLIICPPELAYGDDDVGPIPAKSTLIFEVELVGV